MTQRAVLTGDLIGSTKVSGAAVDHAIATLTEAAARLGPWNHDDTRFTRFRGDGWQIYLDAPSLAFTACLYLTARLRAAGCQLETRISVGIGTIDRLTDRDLSGSSGAAFTNSGHGLDDMPRADRLAVHIGGPLQDFFTGIYAQAEFLARRWSREQAEAICLAFEADHGDQAPTLEDLARRLGISRQALQARLKTAGYPSLTKSIFAFERYAYPTGDCP